MVAAPVGVEDRVAAAAAGGVKEAAVAAAIVARAQHARALPAFQLVNWL